MKGGGTGMGHAGSDRDDCDAVDETVEVDAESGATDWAHAFAAVDPGTNPPPPPAAPPGVPDAVTGATPGVASACADLGLSSVDEVVRQRGIKPPGVA